MKSKKKITNDRIKDIAINGFYFDNLISEYECINNKININFDDFVYGVKKNIESKRWIVIKSFKSESIYLKLKNDSLNHNGSYRLSNHWNYESQDGIKASVHEFYNINKKMICIYYNGLYYKLPFSNKQINRIIVLLEENKRLISAKHTLININNKEGLNYRDLTRYLRNNNLYNENDLLILNKYHKLYKTGELLSLYEKLIKNNILYIYYPKFTKNHFITKKNSIIIDVLNFFEIRYTKHNNRNKLKTYIKVDKRCIKKLLSFISDANKCKRTIMY